MTLHDRRWRPSWKLAAILKGSEVWIVFITLCEHFSCSKIQFIIRMILFNHLLPYIKYKIAFHDSPCRPYWKRRSYCNFVWSAFFSWRAIPIEYLCQSVACIIIWFFWHMQLSASIKCVYEYIWVGILYYSCILIASQKYGSFSYMKQYFTTETWTNLG